MIDKPVMIITGTRKGIGKYLAEYYVEKEFVIIGCSRSDIDFELNNYKHFVLDISDEKKVKKMFNQIRRTYGRLDILINNAGVASMNHVLLTPLKKTKEILNTNFIGTFLFCREAGKIMKKNSYGRIVNFTSVGTKLKIEGEAIYTASKAAVENLTEVLSREYAGFGITVNAIGPTPVKTDLIRSVPTEKIDNITKRLAIPRLTEYIDISNVIDFFISNKSNYITGQTIHLGGA
jgi:3-oxoacyl-[acyl-carrier protein] reductase